MSTTLNWNRNFPGLTKQILQLKWIKFQFPEVSLAILSHLLIKNTKLFWNPLQKFIFHPVNSSITINSGDSLSLAKSILLFLYSNRVLAIVSQLTFYFLTTLEAKCNDATVNTNLT